MALNDTIMVFAFAPIVALLLGLSSITRAVGHAAHLGGALHRDPGDPGAALAQGAAAGAGKPRSTRRWRSIGPWSIAALLATLVLLFAFQGEAILEQPLVIAMLAVPILIQVFFNSALAYWLNRTVGEAHSVACPSALIGASNSSSWRWRRRSACSASSPARRWRPWSAC